MACLGSPAKDFIPDFSLFFKFHMLGRIHFSHLSDLVVLHILFPFMRANHPQSISTLK
jgi:hypothetical protein